MEEGGWRQWEVFGGDSGVREARRKVKEAAAAVWIRTDGNRVMCDELAT